MEHATMAYSWDAVVKPCRTPLEEEQNLAAIDHSCAHHTARARMGDEFPVVHPFVG